MEDCPDGRMDRAKMQVMFKSVIPEVTLTRIALKIKDKLK